MANSPQAIKRVRQKGQNSAVRTAIKKAELAIEQNADHAEEAVKEASRLLDKAVSKGLIKKNKAAREKSRLQKKL